MGGEKKEKQGNETQERVRRGEREWEREREGGRGEERVREREGKVIIRKREERVEQAPRLVTNEK